MKYKILFVLFTIALISSVLLSFSKPAEICSPTEGCDKVINSEYASTLGIKNSYVGIGIFIIMLMIIYSQNKNSKKHKKVIIHAGIIAGTLIALHFLYLQQFVIQSYCKYCLIVDFSLILGLFTILFIKENYPNKT